MNKNKEQVVIAIETSSRVGSVALGKGDKMLAEKSFSGFMKHSSEIFPTIEGLLNEFGMSPDIVNHLYISNGPGSFTGLRIAVSIAKMMYLANSLDIVTVDSLDVIASNAIQALQDLDGGAEISKEVSGKGKTRIASVLDAKRGQFFIAEYDVLQSESGFSMKKLTDDSLMSSDDFCTKIAQEGKPVWLLGDGLLYHIEEFKKGNICFLQERYWSPKASCVYRLGRELALKKDFADPLALKPNYMHRPEIRVKVR